MYLLRGGYPSECPEFGGVPGREAPFGGVPVGGFWPPKAADSGGLGVYSGGGGVPGRAKAIRGGPIRGCPQTLHDTCLKTELRAAKRAASLSAEQAR